MSDQRPVASPLKYDWILDVLADLKDFAVASGLNNLARDIDKAAQSAAQDIASAKNHDTLEKLSRAAFSRRV